ncbi:MAG: 1-acyl-sn-glycerol-3-phosphate acyltransferase [Hylemonella sp.]|nr:1-acyl-sn-glycerol-3-phosphate acyltransferase [Hylemonella sp.]
MRQNDYSTPYPVQFRGSALARWLLRRMGWSVAFEGLPTQQGVLAVYPHTSNWDFVNLLVVKWALGIPVRFWSKDSLFRFPLFGRWMRSLGGVPVERTSAHGVVADTVAQLEQARARGEYFWLALAPEGTRKYLPGWRSGFYRVAVQAGVPLGLARVDYRLREVKVTDFIRLSGDESADFQRIAAVFDGVTGCRPGHAAPIRLLENSVPRSETIVR